MVIGTAMLTLALRSTLSITDESWCLTPAPQLPDARALCGPTTCPEGWVCEANSAGTEYTCRAFVDAASAAATPAPMPGRDAAVRTRALAAGQVSARATRHHAGPAPGQSPAPPSLTVDAQTGPFCSDFIQRASAGQLGLSARCEAELQQYTDCKFLGAGHFGMGVRCGSPAGPVVIKVRYHTQPGTIRNAIKEAVVGCQAALLHQHQVADTFVAMHRFLWCNATSVAPFLHGVDTSHANVSVLETQTMLKRMFSPAFTSTFIMLGSVNVPDDFVEVPSPCSPSCAREIRWGRVSGWRLTWRAGGRTVRATRRSPAGEQIVERGGQSLGDHGMPLVPHEMCSLVHSSPEQEEHPAAVEGGPSGCGAVGLGACAVRLWDCRAVGVVLWGCQVVRFGGEAVELRGYGVGMRNRHAPTAPQRTARRPPTNKRCTKGLKKNIGHLTFGAYTACITEHRAALAAGVATADPQIG